MLQMYVGRTGSGAPHHFHYQALNVLARGEKKWFLFPPNRAAFTVKPASVWLKDDYQPEEAFQCVQKESDVIYIPANWGHATQNSRFSMGIALEFEIGTALGA